MAGFNPFRKFRIYQKYALAALGIMAMISFVILPSYFMLRDSNRPRTDGVIATCRRAGYGNVDHFLLRGLQENHSRLRAFYDLLARSLSPSIGSDWEFGMKYPELLPILRHYQQRVPEEYLINRWLLTRYAQEKGMVVPNKLIVERLRKISSGDISNQLLDEICQQLGLSSDNLIHLLREEMLASYVENSFFSSTAATTPLDRWTLYQRVNRSLTAEVAVIPVTSFQKDVKEPSEMELKKFFEENKKRVYNPSLPDSGFEIPTRFAFQVIDLTPGEQLLASITQEEIEKYYEENKAEIFLRQSPRPQGMQDPTQPPGSSGSSFPFETMFPTIPGGSRPGGLLPGLDSLPGPGLNLDLLDTPSPTENKGEEQGTSGEEPLDDPQSQLTTPAVYRTAAYRQEGEDSVEEVPVLEEEATGGIVTLDGEPLAGATVTFLPKDEDTVPASGITDEEGRFSLGPLPTEEPQGEETPHFPLSTPHSDDEGEPKFDPNILYQPLEEVESTIRRILANQKANAAVKEIEKRMKEYYTTYTISRSKEMEPLDLATLATEYHLEVVTVETPLSVYEAGQHECWQNPALRTFLVKMFGENSSPFEVLVGQQTSPYFSPGFGITESIGWVTKREPRRIPEFTDEGIKELVRDRWLTVHARELAEKRAQELAGLANQSKDQSLSISLAGQDVAIVETGPFSWFTRSMAQTGLARAPLQFGEVREAGVARGTADYNNVHIREPGVAFMETAYSLQLGESGIATNQPQLLVFVIRIIESSPDEELLWRFFVTAPLTDYYGAGKGESRNEIMRKRIEEIESNVGFQWVNRPGAFQLRDDE